MKPLTQKQIRIAWIVAVILIFAPRFVGLLRTRISAHNKRSVEATRRAATALPLTASPLETVPSLPPGVQQRFLGIWDGTQIGDSNCQVHLELRPSPYRPGYVAGYETRICYDLARLVTHPSVRGGLADALRAKSPLATELEGQFFQGDLTFRVSNSIGGSEFTCPLSSYTVMPWGGQDVIAQWKASGHCADGQMVLKRGRG